jgi:hypothetical protein
MSNKPWDPGYSLPKYLKQENPVAKDAVTTPWMTRRTMTPVPKGLKLGGYVQPAYLKRERIGGQAYTTPWLPRGTVPRNQTNMQRGLDYTQAEAISQGLGDNMLDSNTLSGNTLSKNTLQGSTLHGSTINGKEIAREANPISDYGKRVSAIIMDEFRTLPHGQREKALRELLGKIDPSLFSKVMNEQRQFKAQGVAPKAALQHALARSFSEGFTKEIMRLGKERKPRKAGQVALAAWAAHRLPDAEANYVGLSGITSTVSGAVSGALSKIGDAACSVASHPATGLAAGATGAYFDGAKGAATGMAGAQIAQTLCASGQGGGYMGAPPTAEPSWLLPAAIGGGALLLIVALK